MLAQVIVAAALMAQGAEWGDCYSPRAVAEVLAANVPDLVLIDQAEDFPEISRYVAAFNDQPPPAENLSADEVTAVMSFTRGGTTIARFFLFNDSRCLVGALTVSTDRALELRGVADVER